MEGQPETVAIIGGGITGLTTAYSLQKAGLEVQLLEASKHLGGVMQSFIEDGFLAEAGPSSMRLSQPEVAALLQELDLERGMVEVNPATKKRFLVKRGRLIPLPLSPLAFLRTPLFSVKAKLRLCREPFVKKGDPVHEESVAAFTQRRLGADFLNCVVAPFVSGIYAGDPKKLSARYAFPHLWKLEQQYGSLLRGSLQIAKVEKGNGPLLKRRILSFQKGMQTLPKALEKKLNNRVLTEVDLTSIKAERGWKIRWSHAGREHKKTFNAIVLAVPAFNLPDLPFPDGFKGDLTALRKIVYPPLSVMVQGFCRDQITHPLDGFGVLVPDGEGLRILGTIFSSTLFPGRAPPGHVTLTTFVGGACHTDLPLLPVECLKNLVLEDLAKILGLHGEAVFTRRFRWLRAIPQYNLGHGRILQGIEALEKAHPGLYFTGSFRNGVSVGECMQAGLDLSAKILGGFTR